jgi:DNA-binding XRE family transcriptional regulator
LEPLKPAEKLQITEDFAEVFTTDIEDVFDKYR